MIFDTASTLTEFIADEADSLDWLFSVVSDEQPPVVTNADVQVEVM
ncbi:MAG: hypothetical protein ACOH14_13980 [Rhodoglobus sp.]